MKASAHSIRSGRDDRYSHNSHKPVIFSLPLGGLRSCYADCIAVPCQLLNISPTAHKYTHKHRITCTNIEIHLRLRKPTTVLCWQTTPQRSQTNRAVDSHQIIPYVGHRSPTKHFNPDDLDLLWPQKSPQALKYTFSLTSHNWESFLKGQRTD